MALTYATLVDLNANELILDLDADTSITADSDDTIDFKIGGSDEIKMTTAALSPASSDGNALGTAALEWSDLYLADGALIYFGDDQDTTLTHSDGSGLTLNSTNKLMFNDASQFVQGSSATVLSIGATDEVDITATLVDINANVEISGTATTTGVHTFTAVPVLPANSIDSAHYVDGSIDNAHIADDAIDSEHYAAGSIDTAHIANDQITAALIADNAIDSDMYVDGSIDTAHIADNQITLAKMAGGTDGNLITYDASGDPAYVATGSDGQVLTSTGAGSPPAFETVAAVSGTILQTVYVENNTDLAFPQNTSVTTTVVQASITPASASSTILCWYRWHGELNGGTYPAIHLALVRGSTQLQYHNYLGYQGIDNGHRIFSEDGFVKDSPSTTSEITYYLNGGNTTGSSFSGTYGGSANANSNTSKILLMEIGA